MSIPRTLWTQGGKGEREKKRSHAIILLMGDILFWEGIYELGDKLFFFYIQTLDPHFVFSLHFFVFLFTLLRFIFSVASDDDLTNFLFTSSEKQ